jgi:hypothetical protein
MQLIPSVEQQSGILGLAGTPPSLRKGDSTAFVLLVAFVFLSLGVVGAYHHEVWRDEVQAWLIARESSNFRLLIFENLRYEGHPGLWHACLYVLTRMTDDIFAMQLVHVVLATCAIVIFLSWAPFSRWQKLLFCFGYFPFFEYNIISRSYVLGVICTFAFCALFETRKRTHIILAAILFVMSNTSVYGAILAISFFVLIATDAICPQRTSLSKVDLAISWLIFLLGLLLALLQMTRATGLGSTSGGEHQFGLRHFAFSISRIWCAYFPVPDVSTLNFWGTNLYQGFLRKFGAPVDEIVYVTVIAGSFLFLVCGIAYFIRTKRILLCYLSGTLGLFAFSYVVFQGALRHHGHFFLLFIACCWLSESTVGSVIQRDSRAPVIQARLHYQCKALTALLAVHAFAGVYAFAMGTVHPFSVRQRAAQFILDNRGDRIVATDPWWMGPSLSAFLKEPIFLPGNDRFGTFAVHDSSYTADGDCPEIMNRLVNQMDATNREIILVLSEKFLCQRDDVLVHPLARFVGGIVKSEDAYIYVLKRR